MSEMSRSARMWSLIASNWPIVTLANAVYSRVGGEDPRVVGEAGADPARLRQRALRLRVLLALVDVADLQVLGDLRDVGHVLLAPVDALRPAAGRRAARASCSAPSFSRAAILRGERAGRVRRAPRRSSARAGARPLSEPATATQTVLRAARRAGRPSSAAGRRCPCRTGRRRTRGWRHRRLARPGRRADRAGLRAAVAGAGLAAARRQRRRRRARRSRAASRSGAGACPGRGRRARRRRSCRCRRAAGSRSAYGAVEAPRVARDQLGVRVDLER